MDKTSIPNYSLDKFTVSSDGTLVTEASQLQFPVNEFPPMFVAGGIPFTYTHTEGKNDDIHGWRYACPNGRKVLVIND